MEKQNFTVFGDGDGTAPELESMGTGPVESAYNMKPHGYPYVALMNTDLSFSLVAAGHEQVERYHEAKSLAEYLAGEETTEREGKA